MSKIKSTNPSRNYEEIGEVTVTTESEVEEVVEKARVAQRLWQGLSLQKRSKAIESFIAIAKDRSEEISKLIAKETGRTLESSRGNVEGGIRFFSDYLEMAEEYLSPRITLETDNEIHRVYREPWGVVGCICPWNYPFMNVVWQCGQALIAGNTVVYKNSEENPLFSKLLSQLVSESELPDGVMNVIYGDGVTGEQLARADIDMLSFTGSTHTGRKLAVVAAEKFIPFVAELGGSAPLIVFDDIAINNELIEFIWGRRFKNAGQACDAVKRLIIHESKFEELVKLLVEYVEEQKIGDALDENVKIGPLVSEKQLRKLELQVKDAIDKRAKIQSGGKRPAGLKGAYYLPTIITNVTMDMKVWKEEVFGPVLPVVSFSTDEDALYMANDTKYGLGAHIMTNDKKRMARFASEVQSGMIAQNKVMYWHPKNPFGGYKESGMGRLHGEFGFHEVTQPKLVSEEK